MNEPIELSERECRELLSGEVFGRLAITTASGPRIVPLNYVVVDDALVFRTTPYSQVAREGVGHDAAFEIDRVDHSLQTGWSVVAVGSLESVDPAELDDLHKAWVPRPWAGGQRHLYVRLRWREVTGRRIPD
jgi:nitroimidazol reductase NimA-like FMN-containing flavoprotein (pyridoxamine 5'-phosphate oxidase superfamily)